MPDVSFNEPQYRQVNRPPSGSSLGRLIIRMGFAKDEAGAQRVLIIIAITCLILAAGVYILSLPATGGTEQPADLGV